MLYMKKVLVIIALMIVGLSFGCSNGLSTYKEIDYDAYKEMINNKESFILFIGSDECSHCADYEITLNRVIKKYNVEVNYLNLLDMSNEQLNEFKSQISFTGTPTTIFIKNGEEDSHYNRIVGAVDYDEVVKKFEDNGYIEVE